MKTSQEVIVVTTMRKHGSSGLQTYINNLADQINKTGGNASILTPFNYSKIVTTIVFGFRKLVDPFSDELSTWWHEYWHYYFLKLALARKLRRNSRYNITSMLYAQCPLSAKACLETRLPGQRVFMVVHFNVSVADEWADKKKIKRGGRQFRSIRNREQQVIPALDGVVFVSEFMKKKIEQNISSGSALNAACIPCFTSKPVINNHPHTNNDLISIGTLEARKNHAYILKVLSIAKDQGHRFSLTLVGDGPERESLQKLAIELDIKSQVHFLGYQHNGSKFIPGHKIYLHSALIENLPISLLEAQSCGLPIIAPAVGGIPEIISDGKEGFFWPLDDPETGAKKLLALMLNPELNHSMTEAAKLKFHSTFDTDIVVEKLQKFWKQ